MPVGTVLHRKSLVTQPYISGLMCYEKSDHPATSVPQLILRCLGCIYRVTGIKFQPETPVSRMAASCVLRRNIIIPRSCHGFPHMLFACGSVQRLIARSSCEVVAPVSESSPFRAEQGYHSDFSIQLSRNTRNNAPSLIWTKVGIFTTRENDFFEKYSNSRLSTR